jgi:hypothetical protein
MGPENAPKTEKGDSRCQLDRQAKAEAPQPLEPEHRCSLPFDVEDCPGLSFEGSEGKGREQWIKRCRTAGIYRGICLRVPERRLQFLHMGFFRTEQLHSGAKVGAPHFSVAEASEWVGECREEDCLSGVKKRAAISATSSRSVLRLTNPSLIPKRLIVNMSLSLHQRVAVVTGQKR